LSVCKITNTIKLPIGYKALANNVFIYTIRIQEDLVENVEDTFSTLKEIWQSIGLEPIEQITRTKTLSDHILVSRIINLVQYRT